MPHWKKYTDKTYIGSWDFPDGKDFTVEIERVEGGELHNPQTNSKQRKPLVYFKGATKALVLNTTNANTIVSLAGSPMTEDWVGTKITLYATTTNVGGQTVDCIRVRPKAPK